MKAMTSSEAKELWIQTVTWSDVRRCSEAAFLASRSWLAACSVCKLLCKAFSRCRLSASACQNSADSEYSDHGIWHQDNLAPSDAWEGWK